MTKINGYWYGDCWVYDVYVDGKLDSRHWCYEDAQDRADELQSLADREHMYKDICRMFWGLSGTFEDIYNELQHHGEIRGFDAVNGNWIDIETRWCGEIFKLCCWLTGANMDGVREIYHVEECDEWAG